MNEHDAVNNRKRNSRTGESSYRRRVWWYWVGPRRLMGEARNAGRLHHPNIVAVFDYAGEDTTELFRLTVYAPGPGRQLCDTAAELAGEVVRNFAKRLPVGRGLRAVPAWSSSWRWPACRRGGR
ncbi:hypothetical protein [Streptomyces hokutonensis]|uniref:hypothetical protein n=1 Tax=Streptomyces hokutonensis TaxID=1306990 RepID=UPI0034118AFF